MRVVECRDINLFSAPRSSRRRRRTARRLWSAPDDGVDSPVAASADHELSVSAVVTPTSVQVNSSLSRLDSTDVRLRSRLTYNWSKNAHISQRQFTSTSRASSKTTFANRACQAGKLQLFIVTRTCADRLARSSDTGTIYRLSAEQLDRCEAVGATLRATSRATSTGTRKQTRTRTQTNQLKGKRGIWTWVREPNHDTS